MTNPFGNEHKSVPPLSPDRLATMADLIRRTHVIVLGVTYWNCFQPWQVPRRRICDNFLLLVESGEEAVTVGKQARILRRGDAMIVPEYTPHSFGLAGNCSRSSHFIMHALIDHVAAGNPFGGFASSFLHSPLTEALLGILPGIVALRVSDADAACSAAQSQLKLLMLEQAAQGAFRLTGRGEGGDPRIREAIDFIHRHSAANIGVTDIAAAAGLGVVRLRTLFAAATGMTPSDYLIRTRLFHAARLLARYDLRLRAVALEAGFSSESYFCTVFRRFFGKTPQRFRESIRNA